MRKALMKLFFWGFFIVGVAWFAGRIPHWFPGFSVFLQVPLLFLITYVLGELLSRFLRRRECYLYPKDVLKKGAGFVAFSFFVAACIWASEQYVGGQVSPTFFAIVLYFIFRNIRLVEPKRRKRWSI